MFCLKSCYSEDVKLLDSVKRKMAEDLDIIEFLNKTHQI